ncbi:hypothetical protein, variant 4 [Verruconis gallopava]|nr:hypothetical protein, variant 4 [Verruconis gallopava]KIV98370.1 hypothetical protein, variant 4 [Verruconis gallopava]
MNERLSPKLKVSVLGVAPGGRRSTADRTAVRASTSNGRSRGNVIDVRCRLRLGIYSRRNPQTCLHTTHRMTRLHGERRADGRFNLSTTLTPGEKPFEFQMDHMKDIVENDITWREAMAEDYLMRFELIFPSPQDGYDVWEALSINSAEGPNGVLWAQWARLPRCPAANDYLAIFAGKDTTTKYVLNVNMGWGTEQWLPSSGTGKRRRTSTPLEAWNMTKRHKSNGQLPTPVSTPRSGSSIASTDVTMRWHINGQLIEKHGYQCILCGGRDLKSLDKVEVHLVNSHTCLEFSIETDAPAGAIDESVVDIIVVNGVSFPKHKNTNNKGRVKGVSDKEDSVIDDFEFTTPYDPYAPISAQQVLKDPRFTVMRGRKAKDIPQPLPAPIHVPVADVQLELPARTKRRVPVARHPTQPDFRFLSSDNKATLTAGEMLSDEDDDIDEEHLRAARRVEMMQMIPDEKERLFLLDMNTHIESEQPRGDIFLGPCLRRWLHKRRAWLKDATIAKMFEDFLYAAWSKSYISEDMYRACMNVSQDVRNDSSLLAVDNSYDFEKMGMTTRSSRAKDECLCGVKVNSASLKTRISCANKSCIHPEHHKACIQKLPMFKGRTWLPPTWYCHVCLEAIRERLNIALKASVEPPIDLPSPKNLFIPAADPAAAREHWRKVLEEHGFPVLR